MSHKRCPITYELLNTSENYSVKGLKKFSPKLSHLKLIPFTEKELLTQARERADKLSIQGVQPKLSAKLDISDHIMKIVDQGGEYILKPQNPLFEQAPENEDLSMRLAKVAGVWVPFHCLLLDKEKIPIYCIKRFDRAPRSKKIAVEDFAQLSGNHRDTKYDFSMERLIPIIDKFATFPAIERARLWHRTIVNFLIGNEDMHLKNFSLIRNNDKVTLAPAYDFINSSILLNKPKEEIALPLGGKKRNLTKNDLIDYFGRERLGLSPKVMEQELGKIFQAIPIWYELIKISFLNKTNQDRYRELVKNRFEKIN